ncbi:unnamed protein product [Rotaria sp. Silwood1]|nr:unnamed protein product [Rotaria sp. Silwood1]
MIEQKASQLTTSISNVPWQTDDVARLKSRELLVNALSVTGIPEGSGDVVELSARIEDAIFKDVKDTTVKYGRRIRSRIFNLRDLNNPDLRTKVLLGSITPERLAVMTTKEMASDTLKKECAKFQELAHRESLLAIDEGIGTDLIQCENYHAAPLWGQFSCHTIRPMDTNYITDFVNYWFVRVHQHIIDTLNLPLINQGENHSEALKKELETTKNAVLLEMATNSDLLSLIFTIGFRQLEGLPLPSQCFFQYESIVKAVLNLWYITRDNLGILTLRGDSRYGFLHLACQEYFTCLKLLKRDKSEKQKFITDGFDRDKKIQLIAQSLYRHTTGLRLRIPENEYDSLLPLGAYILINFVDNFVNYPSNDVLFNALDRLIIAAGQHRWSIVCSFLFDQIINTLRKFRHNVVSLRINNFLSESSEHDIQTITPLCYFLEGKPHELENIQWLD